MTGSPLTDALGALIGLAVIATILASAFRSRHPLFAKKTFLTRNELEFLNRLERALPELRIHAQVAMGAILRPAINSTGGRRQRRFYASIRSRFSQKICDFALQDRETGEILAIVELDDRTHNPARDRRRDAMLEQAGYRTFRFHSRRKPSYEEIRQTILGSQT